MTTDVADDDEDNADVDEHGRDGADDVDDDMRTECAPAAVVGRLRAGFFLIGVLILFLICFIVFFK